MLRLLRISAILLVGMQTSAYAIPLFPNTVKARVVTTRSNTRADCSNTTVCVATNTPNLTSSASLQGDILVRGVKGGEYTAKGDVGGDRPIIKVGSSLTKKSGQSSSSVSSKINIASFIDIAPSITNSFSPFPTINAFDIKIHDTGELTVGSFLGGSAGVDNARYTRKFSLNGGLVNSTLQRVGFLPKPDDEDEFLNLTLRSGNGIPNDRVAFPSKTESFDINTTLRYEFTEFFTLSINDFFRFPYKFSSQAFVQKIAGPRSLEEKVSSNFTNTSTIDSILLYDINGADITQYFDFLSADGDLLFAADDFTPTPVPAPGSFFLLLTGLAFIGLTRRKYPSL